ncbi:Mobile element protein [uncultured Synechococcales cyanobacterium]|uniref:Mobile element protein n=1 Tax=uncultured Synechococcales cyanobacterium TaxID=1936017 RepID=A0A6J4VEL1_9CYAN|nr:Mobile element protein [uncultured Synechococcales cyanobacterium]
MTILISFHSSNYRNFKSFYTEKPCLDWGEAFPRAVSYSHFVGWISSVLIPLSIYLHSRFGQGSGVTVMDLTKIQVCHIRLRRGVALCRIQRHKVFADIAARGKTSVDWFFGFKLHLVCNDQGELLNLTLTCGNVDERQPVFQLLRGLVGKVVADRRYVSQKLFEQMLLMRAQYGEQLLPNVISTEPASRGPLGT